MRKPNSLETQILNDITANWPSGSLIYPIMADNGNHTVKLEINQNDVLRLIRRKAKYANKPE